MYIYIYIYVLQIVRMLHKIVMPEVLVVLAAVNL